MTWFDDSRLDDPDALAGVELRLRTLAESGARVRREAAAAEGLADAAARAVAGGRPRAVVAAGPDARLLRAVLEPTCPVPFVAWPHAGLPGWAGTLDLVVVLAPTGEDPGAASAVAEAVRRGSPVVVAAPTGSLVAAHAAGRDVTLLPTESLDHLAVAVVVLGLLHRAGLGPRADADEVADALDAVAVACSPHRDLAVNPGKELAITLADATPLVWGGSVLAARAARRVAEALRRATGRAAVAGDAEYLVPVLEAARPRDVFADPVEDSPALRPVLVILDDGAEEPLQTETRVRLTGTADAREVRVELLRTDAPSDIARYASLLTQGEYLATYLGLGLTG